MEEDSGEFENLGLNRFLIGNTEVQLQDTG